MEPPEIQPGIQRPRREEGARIQSVRRRPTARGRKHRSEERRKLRRRLLRKHRHFHGSRFGNADARQSSWFQCRDPFTLEDFYYREEGGEEGAGGTSVAQDNSNRRRDEGSIDTSDLSDNSGGVGQDSTFLRDSDSGLEDNTATVWQRPSELVSAEHLALEWDTTLDPISSHYYFSSRIWPSVVLWRVPNGVDAKRIAHLERKSVRKIAAQTVINNIIVALEHVDADGIFYPPSTKEWADRELLRSWSSGKHRRLSVDEGKDSVSIRRICDSKFAADTESVNSNASSVLEDESENGAVYAVKSLMRWVTDVTNSATGTDVDLYETFARQYIEDFLDVLVDLVEKSFDDNVNGNVFQIDCVTRTSTESSDAIAFPSGTRHRDKYPSPSDKTNGGENNNSNTFLFDTMWAANDPSDALNGLRPNYFTTSEVLVTGILGRMSCMPNNVRASCSISARIGKKRRARFETQLGQQVAETLDDIISALVFQHNQWHGEKMVSKRKVYWENLMVQYGETARPEMNGNGSMKHGNAWDQQHIAESHASDITEDELLLRPGKVGRSPHYSRLQFAKNCFLFGLRAASRISLMLKQQTKSRLCKFNDDKLMSNYEYMAQFGQALADNVTLLGLQIKGHPLNPVKQLDAESSGHAFREALKQNASLVMLHVMNHDLGLAGGCIIFESLRVNSRLYELNLANCKIDHGAAETIALCLRENNNLTVLKLGRNRLGDSGADLITDALWDNRSLKWLDLSHNHIGDAGLMLMSRNLRRSKHLRKLELYGNAFLLARLSFVSVQWRIARQEAEGTGEEISSLQKEHGIEEMPSEFATIDNSAERYSFGEVNSVSKGRELTASRAKSPEPSHRYLINHMARSTVVVQTVRGDDRADPELVVQSVLGCVIGAVERFSDADVTGNDLPAAQMTHRHFYDIALAEGDDAFFTPGDPDTVLQNRRVEVCWKVIESLVSTIELYWESNDIPTNSLEICLAIRDMVDAVVLVNGPHKASENGSLEDGEKESVAPDDIDMTTEKSDEQAEYSSSEDSDSDSDLDDDGEKKEEFDPTAFEAIRLAVSDIMDACCDPDAILRTCVFPDSDDKNRVSNFVFEVDEQMSLMVEDGLGPFHLETRQLVKQRVKQRRQELVKVSYATLRDRRQYKEKLMRAYESCGGADHVLIVVEAIVCVVSEVDLSPVLDGFAALDAEKGPFNMNARKIRRKKREELEALEIGLLDAEYPPQFQRCYQTRLESNSNHSYALDKYYGVDELVRKQLACEARRQAECKPTLESILSAVLSWQKVLDARKVEEELLAMRTPRTLEKDTKAEQKSDRARIKAIRKENKGMSAEEAEHVLYSEKHPPLKSVDEELAERYEDACAEHFRIDHLALLNADEDAALKSEIPTVRLRIVCAKALKNADLIGLSDPFVIVYERKPGKANAAEIGRTQVVDDSLEPVWEEGFDTELGNSGMDAFALRRFRFEVYDDDVIGDNEFLGAAVLTGAEVLERCGKPNKYWTLHEMKEKSGKYVGGRLKLGFDLLGDGGMSPGNDVFSETLDVPEKGDTPIDFLTYGLFRSSVEELRLDTLLWLPVRHLLGKAPSTELHKRESQNDSQDAGAVTSRTGVINEESKDQIRQDLEVVDCLKQRKMSPLEQALALKCLSMNTLVKHLDWSGNIMGPAQVESLCWLFTESNSLETVDMHACGLDSSSWMTRHTIEALTRSVVNSRRPNKIRLSENGGYIPVQKLIGREDIGFSMHLAEPVHLLDDMLVANLVWLSSSHISEIQGLRLEEHDVDENLAKQQQIRDVFDRYDTDRSGELDMTELGVAIRSLGFDLDSLSSKIKAADSDGNGEFNFPEFQDLIYHAMSVSSKPRQTLGKGHARDDNKIEQIRPMQSHMRDDEMHGKYKPYVGALASVGSANGIHLEAGQQLADYAKQPLKLFQISYLAAQLRPSDVCNVVYLSFEACRLDAQEVYASSATSLLCQALSTNHSVTDLNLSDNLIGSAHDASRSLNRLLISNNALIRLNLSRNPLGFQCRPAPSSSSAVTTAIAMGLVYNTRLRSLSLSDCGLQPKGVESLGRSLLTNSSLKELDLSCNAGVTRYGAVSLAGGLAVNTGLQVLNAKGCSIGMAGATAMANMLRRNHSLTDLNLGGNPSDKRGAAVQCYGALAIALALRTNTTLRALRMPASGIEEAGATYMAHMLVINTSLLALDLEGVLPDTIRSRQPPLPAVRKDDPNLDTLIFEEIDIHAAAAAGGFSKKQELDLQNAVARQRLLRSELQSIAGPPAFDGRIGANGAVAIAASLKRNKTLTFLSLAQNNIGNEGAEALVSSISNHISLVSLDISGAIMNEQCIGTLAKALKRRNEMNALRYLIITGSELGREAVAELQDAASGITVHAFEDSPLLESEQLDADDDPLKEIREVARKVREKQEQKALRSRFVIYSEEFPYESKNIAIKDNFNRCPEDWQERLRKAALLDNPEPLEKLITELENLAPEPISTAAAKGPDEKYKRKRH